MTILEALIQLRNDLKLWVTNNLRVKLNRNLGADEKDKFLTVDDAGDIVTTSIDASITELSHMSGVTSNVQEQLDGKADVNHTHDNYLEADDISGLATNASVQELSNTVSDLDEVVAGLQTSVNDLDEVAAGLKTSIDTTDEDVAALDNRVSILENNIPDYITTGAKSGSTIGTYATAEGYDTVSSGYCSHAEGYNTTASNNSSHAEGKNTTASGNSSHAEGYATTASGDYSHASGYATTALDYQFVLGKYNNADPTSLDGVAGVSSPDSQSSDETLFVVGYGTSTANGNAFRISGNGKCRGVSTFTASGADFAELFEWVDGNPDNEDRRGLFVTLDGEKIKIANNGDDYIGVISGAEAFLGNSASEEWQGKYLTDVFGTRLVQTVEIPAKIDEVTNKVITPAHTVTQYVLNPDYNPNEQYIMRENRKEWGMVGLLGQVVVIDDGTCVVGGYVKPSANGIGTASNNGYRVMKRIDENHIKVLVK